MQELEVAVARADLRLNYRERKLARRARAARSDFNARLAS
jgi:hypothetical protein